MRFVDAHVHVGLKDPELGTRVAEELERLDMGLFHCGLTPQSWECDEHAWGAVSRVRVGAGLHPWWVQPSALNVAFEEAVGEKRLGDAANDVSPIRDNAPCGEPEAQLLERLCWRTRYIGEIGLDFGKKTSDEARARQLAYFERICMAAVAASRETGVPRVLSIHSVRAADCALDVLEHSGALEACHCIFHWFSGSSDELHRAVRAGCWFSVNTMGLRTGKGREYAKLIPSNRLLTETDHEMALSCLEDLVLLEDLRDFLTHAIELLAEARAAEPDELQALVATNAEKLLWQEAEGGKSATAGPNHSDYA